MTNRPEGQKKIGGVEMIEVTVNVHANAPTLHETVPLSQYDCNGDIRSGYIRIQDFGVGHDGMNITMGKYDDKYKCHDIASVRLWHTRSLRELRTAIDACLALRKCDDEGHNPENEE